MRAVKDNQVTSWIRKWSAEENRRPALDARNGRASPPGLGVEEEKNLDCRGQLKDQASGLVGCYEAVFAQCAYRTFAWWPWDIIDEALVL
jgi:hypothetical protein